MVSSLVQSLVSSSLASLLFFCSCNFPEQYDDKEGAEENRFSRYMSPSMKMPDFAVDYFVRQNREITITIIHFALWIHVFYLRG